VIRVTAIVVVLILLVLGGALLTSAAVDQPSRHYRNAVAVEAPREAIWTLLTQFDRYHEWNPYITQASGNATVGSSVELTFGTDGGDAKRESAEVLIVHPQRKLEWRTRVVAPGVLDREQIFRVIPLEDGRWAVVQDVRFEGLFAPFADIDDDRAGLADMLDAIVELAPSYQSSSP
jgi:hypothetical protein